MTRTFPPAFLWGVTTGAHQTEGNNRWRQDMDLAAAAGFTDYRFGVE